MSTRTMPHPSTLVFGCMACANWQIDLTRHFVKEVGAQEALVAAAEEANDHLWDDCPGGTTGRVKYGDQWIERPHMSDGKEATGVLAGYPLPDWWVTR